MTNLIQNFDTKTASVQTKIIVQFIAVWPNSKENVIQEILAYAFGLNPKTIE